MPQGITFTGRNQAGGFQNLGRALVATALPKIREAADETGKEGQENIVANASAIYTPRGGSRSEALHDKERYPYEVENKTQGVVIRFRVDGSPGFMAKWGALNYGASNRPNSAKFGTKFWNRGIDDALRTFRNRL